MAGDLHWVGRTSSQRSHQGPRIYPLGEVFWADRTDFCLERIF